jgi:hypothetical protein
MAASASGAGSAASLRGRAFCEMHGHPTAEYVFSVAVPPGNWAPR